MTTTTSAAPRSTRRHRPDPLARVARLEVPRQRERTSADPLAVEQIVRFTRLVLVGACAVAAARTLAPVDAGAVAATFVVLVCTVRAITAGTVLTMDRMVASGACSPDLLLTDGAVTGIVVGVPAAMWMTVVAGSLLGTWSGALLAGAATMVCTIAADLTGAVQLAGRRRAVWTTEFVALTGAAAITTLLAHRHPLSVTDVVMIWTAAAGLVPVVLALIVRRRFAAFDEDAVRVLARSAPDLASTSVIFAWALGVPVVAWVDGRADAWRLALAAGAAHLLVVVGSLLREPVDTGTGRQAIETIARDTRRTILDGSCLALLTASAMPLVIAGLVDVRDARVALAMAVLMPGALAMLVQRRLAHHVRRLDGTTWLAFIGTCGALATITIDAIVLHYATFVAAAAVCSLVATGMLVSTVIVFADRTDRTIRSVVAPTRADLGWLIGSPDLSRR